MADDLYSGYDESNPLSGNGAGGMFQQLGADGGVPGTAMAGPPGTAAKTFVPPGTGMRMGTAAAAGDMGRPMTSNRGAGFSSVPNKKFDPLGQGKVGSGGAQMLKKGDASHEEQARDMERKIHEIMEQAAMLSHKGQHVEALEKAMEARKRERALFRFREQNGKQDEQNVDLTYAVEFALALAYHQNKNYSEALNAYTVIVKNKAFPQSGRLRVNMGNIYFEQKKYSNAIKMYRMAEDQLPSTAKEIRFKIMRNIGLAFVRMGQYQDALQSFTTVMEHVPDHQTGYNLVVCSYAIGDPEGMKRAFQALIEVPPYEVEDDDEAGLDGLMPGGEDDDINAVVQDDGLKDELRKRQSFITRCIVQAAQLISQKIVRGSIEAGFDWCIEQLRAQGYIKLANEVELAKAAQYMASKNFDQAISVFKEFEKKEPRVKAIAATNLSFLYFLEGELDQAEKYSDLALKTNRYNAQAFVNKGNAMFEKGDLDQARHFYIEAAGIEPFCVEAIFNMGITYQRLNELQYALAAFKKLHAILPDNIEVIYQIANTYDMMGDFKNAVKNLELLHSLMPNDPGVLARLGAIHARFDDEIKALHYYGEAHRVFPVNMDVISWLGAYHVKNEVYEKAVPYFDLASKIQPQEVKWALMVASCFRRIGAYPQALAKYKEINTMHPDNVECLRYLVHLCTELGRRDDAQEYMTRMRKAEKAAAAEATAVQTQMQRQQAAMGAESGMGGNSNADNGGGRPYGGQQGGAEGGAGFNVAHEVGELGNLPRAAGKKVVAKEGMGDDDEWGNEALGDDLLPGV